MSVQAIRSRVTDGGVELSLLEWCPTDARPVDPPVLLHHGLASSAGFWSLVGRRLAAGEPDGPPRRVVAIDARGHGESERPGDGYDFATVTADLRRAVRSVGWGRDPDSRPVLVGHSWGGNVVLEFAGRYPDLAAGVVLVDGGFLDLQSAMGWEQTEAELAPPVLPPMRWDDFAQRAAGWWGGASDEALEAVRHNFDELPDGTIRSRLDRGHHMKILRALWEQRPAEWAARVRCPVLMLPARRESEPGSREQRFVEAKGRQIAGIEAALSRSGVRAEVRWFDDTVHDIPLQRPDELAAAIQAFIGTL